MTFNSSISRRLALKLLASTAVLPAVGTTIAVAAETGVNFIVLADLHSAYERTGQLLAAVEAEIAASERPTVVLLNGDLFESGNVVAARSGGEIDWAFLKGLADAAPVVFNIGNHEPDIDNDLAHFVERAQGLGVTVLTNITDTRTGALYAPSNATLDIAGHKVSIAALAVNNLFTYPTNSREQLAIPDPVEWATANLAGQLSDGHINVVMSHAGVVPDKAVLDMVPDGTLVIGAHDHLNIVHAVGDTRYLHTGSWSTAMTVATVAGPSQPAQFKRVDIAADAAPAAALADLIATVMTAHLTEEDRAVVGTSDAARDVDKAGLYVASVLAEKTGADVGFIGHTTFGAGLPQGPVSRYDFNASVRFDGKVMTTQVDAATFTAILERCNQFGDFPFENRTGDYLYAAPDATGKERYTLVCNDWSATNQKNYFGREDLVFTEVPDVMVKSTVISSLS